MTSSSMVYLKNNKANTIGVLIKPVACYCRVKSNRIDLKRLEYFGIKL